MKLRRDILPEMRAWSIALCAIATVGATNLAHADKLGASFWLSGSYASYAAVPATPGWSVETTFYHATADADRSANFTRGGRIEAGLDTSSNYFLSRRAMPSTSRSWAASSASP